VAVSKAVLKAVKAISFVNIDVRNKYHTIRNMWKLAHQFSPDINDGYIFADSIINNVPIRIFCPDDMKNNDIILFIHGGGWVTGDNESYSETCSNICRKTGLRVISADYSLSPEVKFPYALEQCYSVAERIALHSEGCNINAEKLILMGDSAGANLCACISLLAHERGIFKPDSQILLYPVTYNRHDELSPFQSVKMYGKDYFLTSERMCGYMELYINSDSDRNNPLLAPLLHNNPVCQPDTLIITAQYDLLHDEGAAYGEKLKQYGNNVQILCVEDSLHGFITLPQNFEIVKKCYEYINNFLDKKEE
jgi:acetyl esterase/lipase